MNEVLTNSLTAWLRAFRPKTLGAITCPIIVGSALAYAQGPFTPAIMVVTLSCALLLQILANVVNDYGDFLKGADTKERLGPPRAMQMGWITPRAMQQGIAVILFFIAALGLLLVFRGGIPILIIGILAVALCLWYTLGSRPLAYLGFSELVILLFFGPLPVMGAYYLQTLSLTPALLAASIAPAFLSTALMLTNNVRDMDEDRKNNKRTMAVRCGASFSRACIISLIFGALFSPLILIVFYAYPWWLMGISLSMMPALKRLPIIICEPISVRFNLMLGAIGQSLYSLSILLSAGLIYGAP